MQRLSSIEEIPVPDKTEKSNKTESRKRQAPQQSEESSKKIKLGSDSHLQLMQDVVVTVGDLITKVCDNTIQCDGSGDEITIILSSDESEKAHKIATKMTKETMKKSERSRKSNDDRLSNSEELKFSNCSSPEEKTENVQDLMDELMQRTMEISNANQETLDEEESRKFEGKWLQNEEIQKAEKETKDKIGEKKKSQINSVKDEITMSRRGSQESTGTTQTTTTNTDTNNSSSSSSDESSTSDDSSESSSDSDSDSESVESEPIKKKARIENGEKGN